MTPRVQQDRPSTRDRLLDAALTVVRCKGYSSTTVDDLCEAAGVTKGAFFHHFKSKEDLAVQATTHWSDVTNAVFEQAPYRRQADPLDRVLGYVDFRKAILQGRVPEFTCFAGTMVQETYDTSPAIREACRKCIFDHAADVAKDIAEAKKLHAPDAAWSPESLGLHTQAVIQGAFILAKANQSSDVAAESLEHLRRYIVFLFNR